VDAIAGSLRKPWGCGRGLRGAAQSWAVVGASIKTKANRRQRPRVGACGRRSCSRATRSMTKSPSSGRSKPRAVLELIPCCRCGVLFPKTNGRKEKRFCSNECRAEELRFCSKHCQGQHVVETRQLVGRHLNVPPLPPDGLRDRRRRAPPPECTPEDAH
jgi:hypothetical protein